MVNCVKTGMIRRCYIYII